MILKSGVKSVLFVGPGDGIVVTALRQAGLEVDTIDIDSSLNPDLLGSVLELEKSTTKRYEGVACFQVLEHLPHDQFKLALSEIRKCSKRCVFLSLPYRSFRLFHVSLKFHNIPIIFFKMVFPLFFQKFKFDGEHYWEIGSKGHSLNQTKKEITEIFEIVRSEHISGNPYHYSFELKLK